MSDSVANSSATPVYPAYKEVRAPPSMDFGERVLTVATTYPNGHVYFNATMLCNVGREYSKEKHGDGAEKQVAYWRQRNTELIEKAVCKINGPMKGKLSNDRIPPIGQLSIDDVIDTANAKKKTGDIALRGTFLHIALFPALARYVSTDFAVHTDALLSRMFTGDYGVVADVIELCDGYTGATTSKMVIDMDQVRAAGGEPEPTGMDTGDAGMLTLKRRREELQVEMMEVDLLERRARAEREARLLERLTAEESVATYKRLCEDNGLFSDPRVRVEYNDYVRNVLRGFGALAAPGGPAVPAIEGPVPPTPPPVTVGRFLEEKLGRPVPTEYACKVGRLASRLFRERHGNRTLEKVSKFVNGEERKVNVYEREDVDLLEKAHELAHCQ